MIKELKCPNCGGPIQHRGWGKYKCDYCNSEFENKDEYGNIYIIEKEQPGVLTLGAKASIPDYIWHHYYKNGKEEVAYKYIKDELSHQLAQGLTQYLNIKYNPNIIEGQTDIYATVKIIDPSSTRYRY